MKLSIERATLLKAVSQAQSVVERRNTIPILANVLIEASGDHVSFRATDLDIEIVDRVTAMVERAGASTVSAVTLHEIVRKLPDGALVTLVDDGASGRLTVEAGRSNFSLATLPKEDFPVMASSEYTSNFTAPALMLRRLFDKSKFAISTEETRYYLNGVYMHVAEGEGDGGKNCAAWPPTVIVWRELMLTCRQMQKICRALLFLVKLWERCGSFWMMTRRKLQCLFLKLKCASQRQM